MRSFTFGAFRGDMLAGAEVGAFGGQGAHAIFRGVISSTSSALELQRVLECGTRFREMAVGLAVKALQWGWNVL